MPEDDPRERIWGDVASEVAQRFGLLTGRSATLSATINHGARYVKVETDAIRFNARALTLGLLAAGTPDPTGVRYGNAAFWFREWLEERVGSMSVGEVLAKRATDVETVRHALDQSMPVALSVSVNDLIRRASKISDGTVNHTAFEGRHLFAAMIAKGSVADQLKQLFGLSITAADVDGLKARLVDRILLTPAVGETRESWALQLGLPGVQAPTSPSLPGQEIIRFNHDSARHGDDVLETSRDVEALAKLICLKGSTPLAVALFGGWGSGKTTFMESLDHKVEEIAGAEADWIKDGAPSPFVTRVVQIRFNAWQFVDANLWASLTAEFFDQLRAGGWRRAGTVRHAGLVEKVNSHVHSLTAEAVARRAAVIESNRHVLEAQKERDDAARRVRDATTQTLSRTALDTLGEIYQAQKGNLRALGIAGAGQDPTQGVDAVLEAVRSSRSIPGQGLAILRMVGKYRWAWALSAVVLLAAAAAGAWLVRTGPFQGMDIKADIATLLAAVAGLGALWRAITPAFRLVASVGRRGAEVARAVKAADADAIKNLLGKEAVLLDATAKADALAASADQADRKVARYVDPTAPSNPPRLLRYVLEDDPETKAFEKEIGLIGRARRLFQAVNDIILQDDGESPQRVVLYIDDLDRCTEEQVYNVLQAIHLLLAFESFAVVVGVDVKWIEGALAAEFAAERLPPLSEIDRRQHAVHYLEKIFQVAFWLDPLSTGGDDGGSFARFVKELTKPETVAPPAPPPPGASDPSVMAAKDDPEAGTEADPEGLPASGVSAPAGSTPPFFGRLVDVSRRVRAWLGGGGESREESATPTEERGEKEAPTSTAADVPPSGPEASASEARTRAAFRTVEVEDVEIEFLASDKIAALAGSTPRAVKRLVNVYRLVRSRLAGSGVSLLGSDSKPPDYPLVALATAIETGQPVEVATAFLNALKMLPETTEIVILNSPGPEAEGLQGAELTLEFAMVFAHQFRADDDSESGVSDQAVIQSKCPGLLTALAEVHRLRNGKVVTGEVLRIARLARRFSFNRYQ